MRAAGLLSWFRLVPICAAALALWLAPRAEGRPAAGPELLAQRKAPSGEKAGPLRKGKGRARRPSQGPGREALEAMREGVRAYTQTRFDEAVELLTKALELHPGWKTAAGFRAICLWTTGDMEGARRDAGLAANLRPDSAQSFVARGFARFVRREMDLAAKDFVSAAKSDPKNPLAYFGMGSVRSSEEMLDEALTNLDIAVKLAPEAAVVRVVRGTVREKRRDYAGAAGDYTRVIKLNPEFMWAFYYRGRAYRETKEYRKAVSDFSRFLKHNPDFERALYYRSNAYFLSGDFESAVEDLNQVIALNPRHGLAYANRGTARMELGDRDGALEDLNRAVELSPEKAGNIRDEIDRIRSGEADRGEASSAGIAAEPDLPVVLPLEPLPPEEPDSDEEDRLLPDRPAKATRRGAPPARLPFDAERDDSGEGGAEAGR
ncbi:MAG: tetratricopeptide repeat protein [Elusimicrobiota bacterium]